jgi:myo-inositol 2-dehydrogenase/D-chiro-inositol 1-dehydrogenase
MTTTPVSLALIGAGRMGSFHAETIARRLPDADARLHAVVDPMPGAAAALADRLGATTSYTDPQQALADPAIDAVVIATPARTHADLVVAAANAGKAVFCEKPMAVTLAEADRAIAAAEAAGVTLQVGFNRRFAPAWAAAHDAVQLGAVGSPQLLRSLTRDPGLANPGKVPPWTIFLETLIHDFDALRFLNPGAEAVEVYAVADALVAPDYKADGLLDTSVVTITFANGAFGVAEANFSATYGYDVRGEVFGSGGMITTGDARPHSYRQYGKDGASAPTVRSDTELFPSAYTAELAAFVDAVRSGVPVPVSGRDARQALAIALACVRSIEEHRPVRIDEVQ